MWITNEADYYAERCPMPYGGPLDGLTRREQAAILGYDYEDMDMPRRRVRVGPPSRKSARKAERKRLVWQREIGDITF